MTMWLGGAENRNMSKDIQEEYSLDKRVDYAEKLPYAEVITEEYLRWEQSKEEEERKRLYIYRKSGKLALTWGWYMEVFQKVPEAGVEDIDREVLKISSKVFEQYLDKNQEIYQKMMTTIVFILFIYPFMRTGEQLLANQRRMLERIYEIFPWLMDAICEYPGIISRMQFYENIPFEFGMYCLKKWKEDGDKEQEIGEFVRHAEFIKELLSIKENDLEHFRRMLVFMEKYTAESILWQESYAFQLIYKLGHFNDVSFDLMQLTYKCDAGSSMNNIIEQFEKLSGKGINLLETFFKYKNMEKSWGYRDINKIKFFLAIQKDKNNSLCAEEFDKFVEQFGDDVKNPLVMLLEHCQIKMEDKAKLYSFQVAICLYTSEEEIVGFYRKKLFPKEVLHKLMIRLRKEGKIEKIPLLLQWMHGEEEND